MSSTAAPSRGTPTPWTDADSDRLIELYPHHTHLEIARLMGRKLSTVSARIKLMALAELHGKGRALPDLHPHDGGLRTIASGLVYRNTHGHLVHRIGDDLA